MTGTAGETPRRRNRRRHGLRGGDMAGVSPAQVTAALRALGVRSGDLVTVHASLRALGPVAGGAASVVGALLDAVAPGGTLLAFVSWDRSPYEETLNGRRLDPAVRDAWPAFDPRTAGSYPGFGALNAAIVAHPAARRSTHPDASMAAIGPLAAYLVAPHRLGEAYGPGSPLARFVAARGRVLLLAAPLDAVTVLHHAEVLARIPGKRRVSYEMPVLDDAGRKVWRRAEDFDSNGILDVFAQPGDPDAVETIARAYLRLGRHRAGRVGGADCLLFDAPDLVAFGVAWLEEHFGRPMGIAARP